jgi:hypothetical protein
MTDWTEIVAVSEFVIKAPITFEHARAWYNNPKAIAEGAPSAPRVAIDVDGQTAIETDETDTAKVLRPDGAGGIEWGSEQAQNPPRCYRTGMTYSSAGGGTVGGNGPGSEAQASVGITFSAGEFTVPSAGGYVITAQWSGARAKRLQVNSVDLSGLPNEIAANVAVVLYLQAGDVVRIRVANGTGSESGNLQMMRV